MIKKVFLIIGFYFLIIFIQSCCDGNEYEYYSINDFAISNIDKHSLIIQNDSSILALDDFAISVDFETKKYSSLLKEISFINSVYALNCDDEILYDIKIRIDKVTIRSNIDFNETHPKGSDLYEYFRPYRVIKTCMENGGSFESGCAENQFEFYNNLEDVFNNSFSRTSYLDLTSSYEEIDILDLTTKPDFNGYFKFYIDLEFEDGVVITDSTNTIKIE